MQASIGMQDDGTRYTSPCFFVPQSTYLGAVAKMCPISGNFLKLRTDPPAGQALTEEGLFGVSKRNKSRVNNAGSTRWSFCSPLREECDVSLKTWNDWPPSSTIPTSRAQARQRPRRYPLPNPRNRNLCLQSVRLEPIQQTRQKQRERLRSRSVNAAGTPSSPSG